MSTRALTAQLLIVGGLALLVGGLILGFMPKTAAGPFGPVACGSAFHGTDDAAVTDFQDTLGGGATAPLGSASSACAAARSNAKTAPILLLILGAGALIGGAVTAAAKNPAAAERNPA